MADVSTWENGQMEADGQMFGSCRARGWKMEVLHKCLETAPI